MSNESDIRELISAIQSGNEKRQIEPSVRLISGLLDNLYHIRIALEKLAEKKDG